MFSVDSEIVGVGDGGNDVGVGNSVKESGVDGSNGVGDGMIASIEDGAYVLTCVGVGVNLLNLPSKLLPELHAVNKSANRPRNVFLSFINFTF